MLITDVTHRILSCQAAKLLTGPVSVPTLSGLTTLTGHPLRDAIHQKQSGCVTSVINELQNADIPPDAIADGY
jgi:hypothetical protein